MRGWITGLVAIAIAAGGGLLLHKETSGRPWADYALLVSNRRPVTNSPSNSSVESERYYELVWGEDRGEIDGPYTSFWVNGQVWYEGQYDHGEKVGEWRRYSPDGTLLEKRVYAADEPVSVEMMEIDHAARAQSVKPERDMRLVDIPKPEYETKARPKPDPDAKRPPDEVPNFALLDQHGELHELRYHTDAKAIVLFVYAIGCPIVRHEAPAIAELAEAYPDVRFFMIDAALQDDHAEIEADAQKLGIELPILHDPNRLVSDALDLRRTAEALVIDPSTWKLVWRGPISDRSDYETRAAKPSRRYLAEALDQAVAGEPVTVRGGELRGCALTRPEPPEISYADDVVPILVEQCVGCHTEDGVAPWDMEDHYEVRGWSKMIEEVLLTQRMPPWVVDHTHSVEEAERVSLSHEERATLVHWVRQGAGRDASREDPLPNLQPEPVEGWALGEPDWLVQTPRMQVPKTGVLEWTYVDAVNPFGEDKWVRAVHIKPSNAEVLHHAAALMEYPKHLEHLQPEYNQALESYFAMYLPGKPPEVYPDGSAVFLPAGARIRFQLHYTPVGYETEDVTSLAIYFLDEPPERELKMASAYDYHMEVPPHARRHIVTESHTFENEIMLQGTFPHMHYRGRGISYEAVYPDGTTEMLLTIPYFRYDWQRYYAFEPAKRLPAGTKVVCRGLYDNSKLNPYNPDPSQTVHFGGQSWDEMFVGWLYYTEVGAKLPSSASAQLGE